MNIKPLRGTLIVDLLPERVSPGGIIISSENYGKYKISCGIVREVGMAPLLKVEHKKWDGKILQKSKYKGKGAEQVDLTPGDKVFFKAGFCKKVRQHEDKCMIVNYADVVGFIKKNQG